LFYGADGALTSEQNYKEITMTFSDVPLLGKKILIGIIITVIPFLILFGGLWFTKKILTGNKTEIKTSLKN